MKDFRELLKQEEKGYSTSYRKFKAIKIGDYSFSIQASGSHYCSPRITMEDIYYYRTMEIAILKNEDWVDLNNESFFFDWIDYESFLENYDGMVGSYIPIDMIQSLLDFAFMPIIKPIKEYFELVEGDN